MPQKTFYVYILSSRSRNLYIGLTSDLVARVHEHKTKAYDGHTSKYNIDRLVFVEQFAIARDAVEREKEMKSWRRERKMVLIEEGNPAWDDLSEGWYASLGRDAR
jgi:putative endonuclease